MTLHTGSAAPRATQTPAQALPGVPTWDAPAPSGPDRSAGAFEAEARLTVCLEGLLFRALRDEEVEKDVDGVYRLRGGALRPKAFGSGRSVSEAVATGSTVHDSRYIHTTRDLVTAAFFSREMEGAQQATRAAAGQWTGW